MLLLLFLSNVQPQRGLHARGDRDVEKSHFLTFCSEKTDKYVKTPRFCAAFSVLHLSSTHFGPRWETRTPDILLPKQARYQLRYTRLFSFLSGWAYSPKPGAIPTSLYPDIHFSAMIPRRGVKIKFFLSVVILHFSHPTMPRGKKQQEAGRFSARFLLLFCIVRSLSVLLDQRQRYICSEQICVDGQPERAAHQLHKASHDGKPQPAALCVAGGVPAHKALHQLVGGDVQLCP